MRKCHPQLAHSRAPDESFASIVQLDLSGREQFETALSPNLDGGLKPSHKLYQPAPVPPNLLCFQLILKAHLGYDLPCYHSSNAAIPQCALQGGAVVAALTAWRDARVLEIFEDSSEWLDGTRDNESDEKTYQDCINKLVVELHYWFTYDDGSSRSPFSAGDSDIFVQASPLTRNLIKNMNEPGFPTSIQENIESYMGGCGYLQQDLKRLTDVVFQSIPTSKCYEWKSWHGNCDAECEMLRRQKMH